MTNNQINYQKNKETERSNQAKESLERSSQRISAKDAETRRMAQEWKEYWEPLAQEDEHLKAVASLGSALLGRGGMVGGITNALQSMPIGGF